MGSAGRVVFFTVKSSHYCGRRPFCSYYCFIIGRGFVDRSCFLIFTVLFGRRATYILIELAIYGGDLSARQYATVLGFGTCIWSS